MKSKKAFEKALSDLKDAMDLYDPSIVVSSAENLINIYEEGLKQDIEKFFGEPNLKITKERRRILIILIGKYLKPRDEWTVSNRKIGAVRDEIKKMEPEE